MRRSGQDFRAEPEKSSENFGVALARPPDAFMSASHRDATAVLSSSSRRDRASETADRDPQADGTEDQ